MSASEKEELPMLSGMSSYSPEEHIDIAELQRFTVRNRSASMSTTPRSLDYDGENFLVSHTGPLRSERRTPFIQMSGPLLTSKKPDKLVWPILDTKGRLQQVDSVEYPSSNQVDQKESKDNLVGKNEHLLRSGPLGMCNDPYCTTCPTLYSSQARQQKNYRTDQRVEFKFHRLFTGDAKGWMKKSSSILSSCWPGVMNPHAKVVQQWNKFFVISCLVSIFIDPLFFFLLTAVEKHKCIVLHWSLATAIASVRSITDFIYFMHMLLQFRLAYIAPETTVVGAGELVDQPKKIALHYLRTYFFIDVFVVLPLPQIMILFVLPKYLGSSSANYAKNLLRATVLLQYVPKFYRFSPLLAGRSASGFIFETAWANFVINLLIYVLAGHVVGSCWYLFGLQRVNQCLRDACKKSAILEYCKDFIDCGTGGDFEKKFEGQNPFWSQWTNNTNATDCFKKDGDFKYGIYGEAVNLTTISSVVTRYIYSLFWGFQQLSTLAGNLVPSKFVWEVLFTMGIVGLGLFLFALLIGNMQNFLQSLGKRRLEMQLRRQDVEQWMNHRRLPEKIRRQVRDSERFNWAATRGVNEEWMLENLPDDLQREIRRHLFKFVEKVRIFTIMEDPILDAIRERLRQKLYIKGSKILYNGGTVDKMTFIVRGKMESVDAVGNVAVLSEGDTCGEELLTWYLDQSSVQEGRKNIRIPGRVISNRTVTCTHNVEVFTLRDSDLEEVTFLFSRFLRSPRFQGSLRYVSPYWRALAASRIQVAWRYRKKRLSRLDTANNGSAPAQR